jgi:hypothetical protein
MINHTDNGWIFLGDTFPRGGIYIVSDGEHIGMCGFNPFHSHWEHSEEFGKFGEKITHWRPLPNLPPDVPEIWYCKETFFYNLFRTKEIDTDRYGKH